MLTSHMNSIIIYLQRWWCKKFDRCFCFRCVAGAVKSVEVTVKRKKRHSENFYSYRKWAFRCSAWYPLAYSALHFYLNVCFCFYVERTLNDVARSIKLNYESKGGPGGKWRWKLVHFSYLVVLKQKKNVWKIHDAWEDGRRWRKKHVSGSDWATLDFEISEERFRS